MSRTARRLLPWVAWGWVLAAASLAWAEPLPGLLDAKTVEHGRAEAVQQKRDAQSAIRSSAKRLGYSSEQIDQALKPAMERSGTFVTTLKDGTQIEFPWFRTGFAENALANTGKRIARDSSGRPLRKETNKGGVRLHHGVFAAEVYALALKMDTKLGITGDAIDGHSVRGAKGGIGAGRVIKVGRHYKAKVGDYVDPASPAINRQKVMRQFARSYRKAGGKVGPGLDIQAGDVNTKAPEMKVLAETYGSKTRPSSGVSGKAVVKRADGSIDPKGGIAYRSVSTGEGVWMSARLASRRSGIKLRGATVAAQGWGEVGRAFAHAAVKDGARVIAIQNLWKVDGKPVPGTLMHPKGRDAKPREVKAWMAEVDAFLSSGQDIAKYKNGALKKHFRPGLDVAKVKADIVGLNALGNVLTETSVPQYIRSGTHQGKRKVIVEGANLAETSGGAKAIDKSRSSLLVVAGDLANLGGVHVSNLEAVQNSYGETVTDATARKSLLKTVQSGWRRATRIADKQGISERAAIELAAVDAMMQRSLQRDTAPKNSLERGVISKQRRAAITKTRVTRKASTTRSSRTTAARSSKAPPRSGKTPSAKTRRASSSGIAKRSQKTAVSRAGMIRQMKARSQATSRPGHARPPRGPGKAARATGLKAKRARPIKVKAR